VEPVGGGRAKVDSDGENMIEQYYMIYENRIMKPLVFLVVLEFEFSVFTLARQVLFHLSHASSPFCFGCLGDGILLFAGAGLGGDLPVSHFTLVHSSFSH
jgi:hypothetical protein